MNHQLFTMMQDGENSKQTPKSNTNGEGPPNLSIFSQLVQLFN